MFKGRQPAATLAADGIAVHKATGVRHLAKNCPKAVRTDEGCLSPPRGRVWGVRSVSRPAPLDVPPHLVHHWYGGGIARGLGADRRGNSGHPAQTERASCRFMLHGSVSPR